MAGSARKRRTGSLRLQAGTLTRSWPGIPPRRPAAGSPCRSLPLVRCAATPSRGPIRGSSTRKATCRSRSSRPASGTSATAAVVPSLVGQHRQSGLRTPVRRPDCGGACSAGARYEDWVAGLTGDWLVSRQRYFGVPIPVWYQVRADGTADYDSPILPPDDALPVDPAAQAPSGHDPGQRDQPGGFTADPDIMDTWATSSLTPQIAGGWTSDDDLFRRVYPMDLRPQAHEIIR